MVARPRNMNEEPDGEGVDIRYLSPEEGRVFFDETAQRLFGISGEEFIARYEGGAYAELSCDSEHGNFLYVAGLIPFARQQS